MAATPVNEPLLDEKLVQLESARTWSPRAISRLETLIRTGDDYELFRINPLQYAADRNMPENEAIDLFLHATKIGLFEMEWHLVCACCGRIVESLRHMDNLHSYFSCYVCSLDNRAAMDDYIQITFTIAAPIRDITFRYPEFLSIEDFYFKYQIAKGVLLSPGAPKFEDFLRYSIKLLSYLEPQQKAVVELECGPGFLIAVDPLNTTSMTFLITATPAADVQSVVLQLVDGKFQAVNQPVFPRKIEMVDGTHEFKEIGELAGGKMTFEVENCLSQKGSIVLFYFPPDLTQKPPLGFEPFLSGKRLLTTQTFRDLFRTEIVQTSEGIAVQDITLLFTDLKGSTAMYDAIGDAKAFYLVRQHFETLGQAITRHSGAIVKTIGDAVMATFMNPLDALKAALDMLRGIEEFNRNISQEIILKIGIHRGRSIVVTLNERLDYFGQTVNIAARVQGLADAGEIYITDMAFNVPGIQELLADCTVISEQVSVKGVRGSLNVHKVTRQPS